MAYIPVGVIARKDQDPLPSTGPHLDVNIIPMYGERKGQKIDPSTKMELLERIRIGEGDLALRQFLCGETSPRTPACT